MSNSEAFWAKVIYQGKTAHQIVTTEWAQVWDFVLHYQFVKEQGGVVQTNIFDVGMSTDE